MVLFFLAQRVFVGSPVQLIIQLHSWAFVGVETVSFDDDRLEVRAGYPEVHHHLPGLGGAKN